MARSPNDPKHLFQAGCELILDYIREQLRNHLRDGTTLPNVGEEYICRVVIERNFDVAVSLYGGMDAGSSERPNPINHLGFLENHIAGLTLPTIPGDNPAEKMKHRTPNAYVPGKKVRYAFEYDGPSRTQPS